jgi:ABC-type Mn2+/Zn2+ transport system ATPase subunit
MVSATAMIEFDNVTLGYRRRVVVSDLRFTIRRGEFFGIVGANGAGKTTILRALLGMLRPLRGKIVYDVGDESDGESRRMEATRGGPPMPFGYVPQRGHLDEIYPLSAHDVAMMGRYGALDWMAGPSARDRDLVDKALDRVGMTDLAGKWYRDLSGGQKQRVLMARAIASEALALVLDEPTDGMDLEGQQSTLDLVGRLRSERGITVVYVTHRLNELSNTADRLLLLHEGQVRVGPTSELITSEVLSHVYGLPVRVERVDGKRVVLT